VLLASIAGAIIELPAQGWSSVTAGATAIAVITLVVLLLWEAAHPDPLIDLRLFADASFSRAFVTALVAFFAFAGLLFANTFYLQNVRDLAASIAGLLTLPLAAVVFVASPVAGRLVALGRAQIALTLGGAAMLVSAILLVALQLAPVWLIIVPFVVFGAGYGLLNDPISVTAVSELPDDQAGVAASIMSSAKQVGQLLGVSAVGAVVALSPGNASPPAFAPTYLLVCIALALSGLTIVLVNLGRRGRQRPRQLTQASLSQRAGTSTYTSHPTPAPEKSA